MGLLLLLLHERIRTLSAQLAARDLELQRTKQRNSLVGMVCGGGGLPSQLLTPTCNRLTGESRELANKDEGGPSEETVFILREAVAIATVVAVLLLLLLSWLMLMWARLAGPTLARANYSYLFSSYSSMDDSIGAFTHTQQ